LFDDMAQGEAANEENADEEEEEYTDPDADTSKHEITDTIASEERLIRRAQEEAEEEGEDGGEHESDSVDEHVEDPPEEKADVLEELEGLAPHANRSRKLINILSTIGSTVMGAGRKILFGLLPRARRGFAQQGGAGSEIDAKCLVALYLRQLLMSLRGLEGEGNFDANYYQIIGLIAAAGLKAHGTSPDYYRKLQGLFYDAMPTMDYSQIVSVEYRQENTRLIASQIALQAVGKASGEIPSLGNPALPMEVVLPEYRLLAKKYARLPYNQKMEGLCNELSDRLIALNLPSRANMERNRLTRKRNRNAAVLPVNSRANVGHVLGTGEEVRNSWLVDKKRAADNATKARQTASAAEHQRWVNAAAASPPVPGRYAEPIRVRRGGTKRRARGRASGYGNRSSTYKARHRRYTRKERRV